MWENLQQEILEDLASVQLGPEDQFKGLAEASARRAERKAVTDSERWLDIKCDAARHAKRKEQNRKAAKKYLSKPGARAAHNKKVRDAYWEKKRA